MVQFNQFLVVNTIAFLLLQGSQRHPTANGSQLQEKVRVHVLQGNDQTCPYKEDRERARDTISAYVQNQLDFVIAPKLVSQNLPPKSCQVPEIGSKCGSVGWIRVAYLDMTDPAQSCPPPWTQFTSENKTVCLRSLNSHKSCDSVTYCSMGVKYTQVCGRIVGYQYGSTQAFLPHHTQGYPIDTYYIDGISVTHGQSPRKHIWSFASGWSEEDEAGPGRCPCGNSHPRYPFRFPPFVGNNYFCESGTNTKTAVEYSLYSDDPLWDGEGCGTGHSCECTLHNPPWFMANLTDSTTDDIEVRNCGDNDSNHGNVGIELIEIYIK